MTSAPVARRAAGARLAVAVLLGAALTGCGANFQAQTYQERTVADGTNAAAGAIAVRNVQILPPTEGESLEEGADALVGFVLTNDGPEDDRLVEVRSNVAPTVQLVQGEELEQVDEVPVPRLSTTGDQYGAVLQGLERELRPGNYVELTLVFERNGSLDLQVPVATTGINDFEDREHSENFHPIGEEGHGGEGGEAEGGEASETEGAQGEGSESEGGVSDPSGGLSEAGDETQDEQAGENSE